MDKTQQMDVMDKFSSSVSSHIIAKQTLLNSKAFQPPTHVKGHVWVFRKHM